MDYASLLNDKQFAAVKTSSQYVRIIAGAGSGKTRVLTYRVSYLISEMHVDPSRILAIAFTNKVAKEMLDRASKIVYELLGYSPMLHISTFHSFCSRFLRAECKAIDYPSGYTIYDDDDQKKLIKNIAVDLGYKKGDDIVKSASKYISSKKTKGIYPEDINIKNEAFKDEKICLKFYMLYEQKKSAAYALDFDDLLLKTIYILENFPAIREKWASRFDHILVDEFQDTNDVQYKLMKLLIRKDTSIYVVGDPDQTIYTWRGANQNIILNFEKEYPNVETVILNENYRSTKTILASANKLIANNKKRVPKDLFTNAAEGVEIKTNMLASSEEEASWVGKEIARLGRASKKSDGEPDYSHIAILYRSSYMTRPFESELKDRGIPYRIFGGLRFYERMEVKDLLAYFNLMLNPSDNIAFERIANVPRRSVGDTSIERIRNEATEHGLSEYDYIKNISTYYEETSVPSRSLGSLGAMVDKMEATKAKLKDNLEVYSSVLKDFTEEIGYFDYLKDDENPDEDRIGNVNALLDDIAHFISSHPESTFDEYLQNVSLLTAQDDMNGGNYVSLMTIHVAKGLEFDDVFVISMNEGAFPSMRAENENGRDGLEEERRLAYVAFTRAKKELYVSCNTAYSYQTDSHSIPSRFFKEAGLTLPKSNSFTPNWNSSWNKPASRGSSGYFADGDSLSPFDEQKKEPETPKVSDNGIRDWKVGDKAHHEKFGDGIVIEVIDNNIIIVNFDSVGKKTLLGSHPMLSKASSKGGEA
ncbi:MAG: UvrD-helicase domain-containing protein [Bacilli bacterium]|jgi:DNA helicase-2/ATP-dependent DNA helicase PcrA|nr:UvrD-helicase domain-containing protein [Bacilli bacterium]